MPKGYNDVNMAGINTLTDYDMLGNSNPFTNMFTSSPEDDTKPSVTQDAVPQQDLWSLLPDSTYNTQSEDWTNLFRFTQPIITTYICIFDRLHK
ncbi:hypothetical protein E3Q01_04460 [Wallemia mellicola]|uniref:Uncharacterized protein n=1 Tax=Wallemia mellicola TaxID=1708541 RepID=A0A4T0T6X8_9BASI|nr:hypothetical protein E3Q01_04460 [Wallemia mellicola]